MKLIPRNVLLLQNIIWLFPSLVVFYCSPISVYSEILSLDVDSQNVEACQDYFTSEWASPLDMNESSDILYNLVPREVQQMGPFSFSDGIFSTTATGSDPYFRLLSWVDNYLGSPVAIPDDTTRFGYNKPLEFPRQGYRQLSFRMYSSVASDFQILWEKTDGAFGIINPVSTYPGWRTYSVDLATAGLNDQAGDAAWSNGKVAGLRIDPARFPVGAEIKFDWIQLTKSPASCSSITANYRTSRSDLVNVILDNNNDLSDGYITDSGIKAAGDGSIAFNTSTLFPGSYIMYALGSKDFASLYGLSWDMDNGGSDLNSDLIVGISKEGSGFSGDQFCGSTVSNDPSFYLNIPEGQSIDTSVFKKLSLRIKASRADGLYVYFFDLNNNLLGLSDLVPVAGGGIYNTYNIDLSSNPAWRGRVGAVRVDPAGSSGVNFCVDWVSLGTEFFASEPAVPTKFSSARNPTISDRPVVKFVQPDREGGEDFFVAVRGRPSSMGSASDVQLAYNLSEAWIYPGNVYTDSAGAIRSGDFFQASSKDGNDDPNNFSVFQDNLRTIDPTKYKIACFTLDVLKPVSQYHSMARVLWQLDSQNINGDDLILKTSGESRYCLRMDTMQTEPASVPGPTHPWRKNSDGTGINFWRIDAHEESVATTFRFDDIRLAADHLADDRFLLVLEGSRDRAVSLYYSALSDGTNGTLIDTLPINRNSDIYLWNTSAITEGTWYLYLRVGAETYLAPGPLVIRHRGSPDTVAPVLSIDAPLNGHRFTDSLEFAGFAVDNLKIAAIEAFLDGQLISNFRPSQFRKNARDAYPGWPYSSNSGFQFNIAIPNSVLIGTHSLILKAYDSMGNMTQYAVNVEKVNSGPTAAVVYPIPDEARVAVPIAAPQLPQPTATPATPVALTLGLKQTSSSIAINISGAEGCGLLEVLGNIAPNKTRISLESKAPKLIISGKPDQQGAFGAKAMNLKSLKAQAKKVDTSIYLLARCDGVRYSAVKKISATKIKRSKSGEVKNIKAFLNQLKSKTKKLA